MSDDDLVQELLRIQESRAQAYREFNNEFKEFLSKKNLFKYQQSINTFTTVSKDLSARVIEIRDMLGKSNDKDHIIETINQLQTFEKEKLQLVIKMQSLKKVQILDKEDLFEVDPEYVVLSKNNAKKEQELVESISDCVRELRYYKSEES